MLYLDDSRFPKSSGNWRIARSVDEAIQMISEFGLPDQISFDHDLGENQKTGYDFAKWIVWNELDTRGIFINVHSANPIGRDNIYGLIRNWENHLNNQVKEN